MFRLLNIKTKSHPQLGDVDITFLNKSVKSNEPYTTLIIGQNGSGKTQVLKLLVNIFRELESIVKYKKKRVLISGQYSVKYMLNGTIYSISNFSKNSKGLFDTQQILTHKNNVPIEPNEVQLPQHVVANSILLNDKFPMIECNSDDIYQYMGVRRSPSIIGTKSHVRKTVRNIIDSIPNFDFHKNLKFLLQFLGYKKSLVITYGIRYRYYFYKGNLTIDSFKSFFEDWETNTNRSSPPYGFKYYNKIKDNTSLLKTLVAGINELTRQYFLSFRGEYIHFDVFKNIPRKRNISVLNHLDRLDLITHPTIQINKNNQFDVNSSSSGEFHIFMLFLGIFAKIQDNCLILIDEPELSLHPSWQIQYIDFINDLFSHYNSCHFILATHSHFIVSDLIPESSAIISLSRNGGIKSKTIESDTRAWSAEEILYEVFKLRTVRNYYFEEDLRELVRLISNKSNDFKKLNKLVLKLGGYCFSEKDPINELINQAKLYISNNDKTDI